MTTVAEENVQGDTRHQASGHQHRVPPSYDDVNTPVVMLVGLISAIVTFLTIAFVQGLFYQWQNSFLRERTYDFVNLPVKQVIDQQKSLLAGSDTTISIDEAMKKVIAEYNKSRSDATSQEETSPAGEQSSQ
jgi:hypothetical protein